MGVVPSFEHDFFSSVQQLYFAVTKVELKPFQIVCIKEQVYVHLVPLRNKFLPQQLLSLQAVYQQKGLTLVHLWEDVWHKRRNQVLSRIHSFCGFNQTLHGRKSKIIDLKKPLAEDFLEQHHLQGYINTKYNYGLTVDGTLMAVACISATRPMKSQGENYTSAELVRFATLSGHTVVGGLSKLISHFTKEVPSNDLMTYADRDWSLGKGYDLLNFQRSGISSPGYFYLDQKTFIRYAPHRLPKATQIAFNEQKILNLDDFLLALAYKKVFNTGNLKYHLFTQCLPKIS